MPKTKPTNPMDCYTFGRRLLELKDLDPVYEILHHAALPQEKLRRWLLAYWCFYHVGTASWIADQPVGYWGRMFDAAGGKEHPRSSERRHFRGLQAMSSIVYLEGRGVRSLFDDLFKPAVCMPPGEPSYRTASAVIFMVKQWTGFGPWISFKVADMVNALGLLRVRFDVSTAMYEGSPTEAAALLWEKEMGRPPTKDDPYSQWAVERVLFDLGKDDLTAPPLHDRPLEPQEAETVLCKWFSYTKGSYHLGEDVEACHRSLTRYDHVPTARRLLSAGAEAGLWPKTRTT